MWPDYNLDKSETWTVMEAPPVDNTWVEELTRIGGKNPLGQPNLVWRWGATYIDPMSEDGALKYWLANKQSTLEGFEFTDPVTKLTMLVKTLKEVPEGVIVAMPKYTGEIGLGERRIIIEQWRSPEFLARSGRYRENVRRDNGQTYELFCCRGCDTPLFLTDDGPKPCEKCGSKRHYVKTHTETGDGILLRSFPREGAYDFFLRLENTLGQPMEPDAHALRLIEEAWYNQKNATDHTREQNVQDATAEQRATMKIAASNPTNPFAKPAVAR